MNGVIVLLLLVVLTRITAKSKLSLWIDEAQVANFIGYPFELDIISNGKMSPYLLQPEFNNNIPILPPTVDTVNLTWEAGDEKFTYWFDGLKSLNTALLYHPLLSIPAYGIIPKGPKIFQMSIPCTGNGEGVAELILGLQILDQSENPIQGSPIKLKLKKQCKAFVTTSLCKNECQNSGRCNQFSECDCKQGYHGKFCEIDMCSPSCENNGTCISPDVCLCLDGFYGKRCEKALCSQPCQNGGRCVQPGFCWCTSGFYGEACQYSYCITPCKHGGLCIGQNKCKCLTGYSGDLCEKDLKRDIQRPRRSKSQKQKKKKRRKKKRNKQRRKNKLKNEKKLNSKKENKGNKKNTTEPTMRALSGEIYENINRQR